MRILFRVMVVVLLMAKASAAAAAEDVTTQALRLYEKHHYEDAERLLLPAVAGLGESRKAAASLALGMNFLGSAELYQALYRSALVAELDYLTLLGKQKASKSSRYVALYLGQVLSESGRHAEAAVQLHKAAAAKGAQQAVRLWASIELAADQVRQRQHGKALQALAGLDDGKAETQAALAAVYALAGMQEKKPEAMAEAAQKAVRGGNKQDMRMLRNLLRVYSHSGALAKALELQQQADMGTASVVEDFGNSKSISFYDASLMDDLARVHLAAAQMYLEQAARDAKLAGTAHYYLAQANLLQGKAEAAYGLLAKVVAEGNLPAPVRQVAQAQQGRAHYLAGKRSEAMAAWETQMAASPDNPVLLAVILTACTQAGADCSKLERQGMALADKGEGKRFFPLYSALGMHYMREKKYAQAFQYLEAGRDKANKNKIEANDPLMMVSLAEACYRNRKYSENLEIYFELGKQFPLVRQIQEAMQGIYAMEQRSAGEVKIF